jgi:gamma-butyrobetaine dioxygenase
MLQAAALAERAGAAPALIAAASVYTLGVRGGPMQEEESAEFARSPFAADACQVHRFDDAAKDPDASVPRFEHFAPVLAELLR